MFRCNLGMYRQLDINAEYVIICRDQRQALALKMDLDIEAPNILIVDEHCVILTLRSPAEAFNELAIGDRFRATKIRSEKEDFAIPMSTRQNSVHWHEASPPRSQAVATEGCVTKQAQRVEKIVFYRVVYQRQRFFDPFEKRERNLP